MHTEKKSNKDIKYWDYFWDYVWYSQLSFSPFGRADIALFENHMITWWMNDVTRGAKTLSWSHNAINLGDNCPCGSDCIAFSKNHLITWSMTYVILLCGPIILSYNLLKLMAIAQEEGWSQSFLGISRDLVIDTPSGLEDIISLQQVI